MAIKVSTDDYLEAAKYRRTVYGLNDKSPVSDDRIVKIVEEVALSSPSSYNTQTGRFTILLGSQHKKLWDVIEEKVLPLVKTHAGEEIGAVMAQRIKLFSGAYGSVLFWESNAAVKEAEVKHPHAASKFAQFSEHASAMAQVQVWTALELEGFGANLQHMAAFPGAEDAIREQWNIPADWSLKANMNFGGLAQEHPERPEKLPIKDTLTVYSG